MNRKASWRIWLQSIIQLIGGALLVIVLLLMLIPLLVNFKPVRKKIISHTSDRIQTLTQANFSLSDYKIIFPLGIRLESISYSDSLSVADIDLLQIKIRAFSNRNNRVKVAIKIQGVDVQLFTSTFKRFSGNKKKELKTEKEKVNWELGASIDGENLSFVFNQDDTLQLVDASVKQLKARNLVFETLEHNLNWQLVEIDSACTSILLGPSVEEEIEEKETEAEWNFSGHNLKLKAVNFDLAQLPDGLFLAGTVSSLTLKSPLVDLATETISVDNLAVEGVKYQQHIPITSAESDIADENTEFAWSIRAEKAHLKEIDFYQNLFESTAIHPKTEGQQMSISDFYCELKNCELSEQQAGVKIDELNFLFNGTTEIDKSEIEIQSNNSGTAAQILVKSGESEIKAKLSSEARIKEFNSSFPFPEMKLNVEISELRMEQISDFLSDSINWQLRHFSKPISILASAHTADDWLEVDTLFVAMESQLKFSAHVAVDQYVNRDSLIFRGNTKLDIRNEFLRTLPVFNSSATTIQIANSDYLLEGEILGTSSSLHLNQLLRTDFAYLPINASYFEYDSSFSVIAKKFSLNADTLLSIPIKINSGDLEISGNYREGPMLNYKGVLGEYNFMNMNLANLLIEGKMEEHQITGILNTNDSVLNSKIHYLLDFAETLTAHASGFFDLSSKLPFSADSLKHFQSAFNVQYKSVEEDAFEADFVLSDIVLKSFQNEYKFDTLEIFLRSNENEVETTINSDIISGNIKLEQNFEDLQSWIDGGYNFSLATDSASVSKFVSGLPPLSAHLIVYSNEFIEELVLKSKLIFNRLQLFVSSNIDEQIELKVVGNELRFGNSELELASLTANFKADQISIEGDVQGARSPNYSATNYNFKSKLELGELNTIVSGFDNMGKTRLLAEFDFVKDSSGIVFKLPQNSMITFGKLWNIESESNFQLNSQGIFSGSIRLNMGNTEVLLGKTEYCPYALTLKNYEINQLAGLFNANGKPGGILNVSVCMQDSSYTDFITSVEIKDLKINNELLGNYLAKASVQLKDTASIGFSARLSRDAVELISANGKIDRAFPKYSTANLLITDLQLKHLSGFMKSYLTNMEGTLNGKLQYNGKEVQDIFKGDLSFEGLMVTPAALNSEFKFKDASIILNERKISLDKLVIYDSEGKKMLIEGYIELPSNKTPQIQLSIKSDSMQIMNVPKMRTSEFYGRVVASSNMKMRGDLNSPGISLDLAFINGTDFTFQILEDLKAHSGAGVVSFISHEEDGSDDATNYVLGHQNEKIDLQARIKIDPKTKFHLNYDQNMRFEIELLGNANLNYSSKKSGAETMTGNYSVNRGEAVMKLQGIPPRNFTISPSSFVRWDGIAADPVIDILAYHTTRGSYSSPISGVDQTIVVDYEVILAIKDRMTKPNIVFDLRTKDEYMTSVLNGMTEEERIRQAINVLLLGQVVTEESKITGANILSDHINQFWANQLNNATAKNSEGVKVSVDISSYTAHSQSGAEERTDFSYEVSKDIWNDRAVVKVGGYVRTGTSSPDEAMSKIIGDVSLEYQLKEENENLYGKVFSENKYEGILDGEIQITGAGILYRQNYQSLNAIWEQRRVKKAAKKEKRKENAD